MSSMMRAFPAFLLWENVDLDQEMPLVSRELQHRLPLVVQYRLIATSILYYRKTGGKNKKLLYWYLF